MYFSSATKKHKSRLDLSMKDLTCFYYLDKSYFTKTYPNTID